MLREVKTYCRFNSGFFYESNRSIRGSRPNLRGGEELVASEILQKLERQEKVVVLDLGAMLATSLIVLADHFKHLAARVKFIATNRELVSPEDLVNEARARLNMFGSEEDWSRRESLLVKGSSLWVEHRQRRPLVPDRPTLAYVEDHLGDVHYLGGVDTLDLPERLGVDLVGGVSIVHEHCGGVYHHQDYQAAINAVSDVLEQGGTFITHNNERSKIWSSHWKIKGLRMDALEKGYRRFSKD